MFRSTALIFIALFAFASVASAQLTPAPTMTGQINDSARDDLYNRFAENKKVPVAERQRLAYEAARDYVKRFNQEGDPHFVEMRKFVTEYERVLHNYELHELYAAKKYPKVFESGRATLKKDAENFYVLATLTQAGYELAQSGDATLNEETVGYARTASTIADSGKLSQPAPFATLDDAKGFLNFVLGWFLRAQSPVEAAEALTKAAKSASRYKDDPLTYNLLGIAILKGEYAHAAADYNTNFGNKPPSPEQEAAWGKLSKLGERVIDAYARAVALSTRPDQAEGKTKMLNQLTSLYKSFHNNSDAGLNDLIASVLSKPLP